MLARNKKTVQQWEGKNELIDFLLSRRHHLIVTYYKIARLPPFSQDKRTLPTHLAIEEFCNILVDYISMGHFEIYDTLVVRYEMNGKLCPEEVQFIMPLIDETTPIILYFTDKYSELSDLLLNELDSDLSIVMESLDQRFELENKLLSALFEQVTLTA